MNYLFEKIKKRCSDISRIKTNELLKQYDNGVLWEKQDIDFKGFECFSAYFPVWLFSLVDKDGKIYYIAVNGRDGRISGSIATHITSAITYFTIFIICSILLYMFLPVDKFVPKDLLLPLFFFLLLGLPFLLLIISLITLLYKESYNNLSVKYHYEKETKCDILNYESTDVLFKHFKGVAKYHWYKNIGKYFNPNNEMVIGDSIYDMDFEK